MYEVERTLHIGTVVESSAEVITISFVQAANKTGTKYHHIEEDVWPVDQFCVLCKLDPPPSAGKDGFLTLPRRCHTQIWKLYREWLKCF